MQPVPRQPAAQAARADRKAQAATIRYPVEGKLIGDWKKAKLAAVGTGGHIGFIQPDPPGRLRGGNCYACHQLAKEVAYGTIGPSLHHFGKLRGTSDGSSNAPTTDLQLQRLHRVHSTCPASGCTAG